MIKKSKLTIYVQDETDFSHNGLGILHPKSCKVERNLLEYTNTMNLVYPIDDTNKWLLLLENRVIKWKQQYYRIYNINKSVEKKEVTVYAKHIFFDLQKNFIFDVNVVNKDGALALTQLLGGTQYSHRFTGHSNIGNKNNLRMVRKNVVDALIGDDDNTFINRWGGELDFDGFNFYFNDRIGADNGYKIKYGKNLQGLTLDINVLSVVTRIIPIGFDGIMLDEKYVDSAYIDNYAMPIIKEYKYENVKWSGSPNYEESDNDDSVVFDNLADAQAELRRRATLEFTENEVDLPTITCNVDFLELSKTEEYAKFTHLETVNLGDTVTIYHRPFNVQMKARCTAYVFDVLKDAYESITLGSYVKNYFTESNNASEKAEELNNDLSNKINSFLQTAKKEATNLINSAMGGYVYKTNNALYIMDNEDPKLAKRVWCWNINGLGYSSTGIDGEYGLAMTMDGSIVADFIKVGNLNGNLITANTIKIESLELETQQKITNATDEKQVTTLIKAGLDGFESKLSETFVTHEQSREDITNATNEILTDTKDYVTTKLESYDTIESVNSKIEQSKNAIELGISTKYETKENVETKVTEAIDGVTVGAINRVFGASEQKSFTFKGGSNDVFIAYDICEDIGDKEVIVSFDYTFVGDVVVGSELKFQSQYLSKSNQVTYAPKHIIYTSNSVKSVNLSDTVKFNAVWNGVKQDCKFRFVGNGLIGTFTVNNVQIKVGNKLTEWSVAPEDIEKNANDFTTTQLENYYTKKEIYTKEEVDNAITVNKDGIMTQVSNTYETKENVTTKIDALGVTIDNNLDEIRKVNEESTERLDKLVNDDIITTNEKVQLNYEYQLAIIKYDASKTHYITFNAPSCEPLLNAMTTAFNDLTTLIEPVIADMTTDTAQSMSEIYNAFNTFYDTQESLLEGLNNTLTNQVETNKSTITQLASSVDIALSQSKEALGITETYSQHFKFSSNGWVEIFATVNGEEGKFKTQITNEKLAFLDNNIEVAYISNKSLYITDATITNSLNIGKIEFVPSALGGVMMIWKG